MNNTFDFNRFGLLFRKHTVENFRNYLMSLVVLCGMLVMVFSFGFFVIGRAENTFPEKAQFAIFIFFFLLAGTIFTSTIYSDLSEKKHAISSLVLPVSSAERFFVGWLYTVVLFPVLFLICFYAIDSVFVFSVIRRGDRELLNVFSTREPYCAAFWMYALLNGIVLWGAAFFEKLHFIKTAFFFFLCALIVNFLNVVFIRAMIDEYIISSIPFTGVSVVAKGAFFRLAINSTEQNLYVGAAVACLTLLFWASAYFRIKEKEV